MTTPDVERQLPHACGKCPNRWAGTSTAHCGACHNTFTAVGGFDRHRRNGACVPPASVGMVARERPGYVVWGMPADEARMEQLRALRSAA
jgi:hypothetical protein